MKISVKVIALLLTFTLAGPPLSDVSAQPVQPSNSISSPKIAEIASADLTNWRDAETKDTTEAYQDYLTKHPNGWFAPLARSHLEPSLPESRPAPPIIDFTKPLTPADTAAQSAYDDALWALAQSVGTQNAAAEYLRLLPIGRNRASAAAQFIATVPKLPDSLPPDCTLDDKSVKRVRNFNVERAYPTRAIVREIEEIAIGRVMFDHRGKPLAFVDGFFTQPELFQTSVERAASRMAFQAPKAGCLPMPFGAPIQLQFRLDMGTAITDARVTPPQIDANLVLGQPTEMTLPEGQARRLSVPHDSSTQTVYFVKVGGLPNSTIAWTLDNINWRSLVNNTHFMVTGPATPHLRVSVSPSRSSPRDVTAIRAPFKITVSAVYSEPVAASVAQAR